MGSWQTLCLLLTARLPCLRSSLRPDLSAKLAVNIAQVYTITQEGEMDILPSQVVPFGSPESGAWWIGSCVYTGLVLARQEQQP